MILELLMACALAGDGDPPAAAPVEPKEPVVIETIEETTVGDLDGVRVPMGNMTRGAYKLPDGTEQTGLICALALKSGPVFVGKGSIVEVEGTRWEVTAIEKEGSERGSVTLKRLD